MEFQIKCSRHHFNSHFVLETTKTPVFFNPEIIWRTFWRINWRPIIGVAERLGFRSSFKIANLCRDCRNNIQNFWRTSFLAYERVESTLFLGKISLWLKYIIKLLIFLESHHNSHWRGWSTFREKKMVSTFQKSRGNNFRGFNDRIRSGKSFKSSFL